MHVVARGNGLYEIYDGPLGKAGVPHAVYVLGEGSCTCAEFERRAKAWNPDDTYHSERVWCIHLEEAARHYNRTGQPRRVQFTHAHTQYDEEAFANARDDLIRMLDDMSDEE